MRKVVVKAGRIGVRAQEERRYTFLWNGRVEELRKKSKTSCDSVYFTYPKDRIKRLNCLFVSA